MLTIFLLFLGFILLIKGADFLVDGASSMARKWGIPPLVIGLTIVAFGTSAPELIVSVLSGLKGSTDIAVGNVLGSNIANILLILGVAAFIYPLKVTIGTIWKEIPLSILALIVLGIMGNDIWIDSANSSFISTSDGLSLLAFFIIFIYYTYGISKEKNEGEYEEQIKMLSPFRAFFMIVLGLLGLGLGGAWVVNGAVEIATLLGLSERVIGLTIVAIGTSLPELFTSAIAAYKKQPDIAVGNVVGSNIFNVFFVLGVSATISPLPFTSALNADLAMALLAAIILFIFMFLGKRHHLTRWEGLGFLIIYFSYLIYLI